MRGSRRTLFFGWEFSRGDVVCDGARMKLSPDVEDVLLREACRREAIKAAQGLDLCLLCIRQRRQLYPRKGREGMEWNGGRVQRQRQRTWACASRSSSPSESCGPTEQCSSQGTEADAAGPGIVDVIDESAPSLSFAAARCWRSSSVLSHDTSCVLSVSRRPACMRRKRRCC